MVEIRNVWKTLRIMMPKTMASPALLQKQIKFNPNKLVAKKKGYSIHIATDMQVRLPRKKPQMVNATIEVTGLTLESNINIDEKMLINGDSGEMVKAFLLAGLLALGIFNNQKKREAFEKLIS